MTFVILAALTAFFSVGATHISTEFGYRILVGDDHPAIRTLDSFIAQFGGGLPIKIVWRCGGSAPCNSAFDESSLSMAAALTRRLEASAHVRRVHGIASAPIFVPNADGFSVRRLIEHGSPAPDADALIRHAMEDDLWNNKIVSLDGRAGVVIVQPIDTRNETALKVVEAIEAATSDFESMGFSFHAVGAAADTVRSGRELDASTSRLVPVTVLVIGAVLLVLTRSWIHALTALATMGVALLWTFGLLGWLGWPQDGILEVLAPLILVVGVCDAVHLLARYSDGFTRRGQTDAGERANKILRAAADVGAPCLITTLTTAGGFLSFATSALDTFVRFAWISAFGTVACLFLTFSLLPLLAVQLGRHGIHPGRASAAWQPGLQAIVRSSEARAPLILLVAAAALIFFGYGWLFHLRVDTDWLESWGESSQVAKSIHFVEDQFGSSDTLELQITLPPGVAFSEPRTLRTIDSVSTSLSEIPGLGNATSALDVIKRVNRLLHDDDPRFGVIGISRAANAELLELISLDGVDSLENWISFDRSTIRVSVQAGTVPYASGAVLVQEARRRIQEILPQDWAVALSGELAINNDWIRDVQGTQMRSFPTAFVIVFVLSAIFLRSAPLALAALLPTLIPVVVTLGTMGWLDMSLDIGRAMIAAIVIGIGVDDSIHLLHHYRRRRAHGDTVRAAVEVAINDAGRAVITTSIALAAGFLTLMASAWQTISSFGFFVSQAILGALVAALLVMPALLFWFAGRRVS